MGIFWIFYVLYSTLLHLRPSDSTVSEDAGIEPRTVATSGFAVRRFNHLARSHPHFNIVLFLQSVNILPALPPYITAQNFVVLTAGFRIRIRIRIRIRMDPH
jgi:hypothetical protein